jgi:hypothetical protein
VSGWITDVLAGGVAVVFAFVVYRFFLMLDELRRIAYENQRAIARLQGRFENGVAGELARLRHVDASLQNLARTVEDHVENEEHRFGEWVRPILKQELEIVCQKLGRQ